MSNNPNRNKVLLGFGAVVAVLIVVFVMWPANVTKEDASGAIGAVQKHHAPQITQQDVVLGNEAVKRQQEVLYKDFLADAGKLRAIGSRGNAQQRVEFANELQMRAMRADRDAVEAASRINDARFHGEIAELSAMIRNKSALSAEEQQTFNRVLGRIAEQRENANIRLAGIEQELHHLSLGNEQAAIRTLADAENAFNRVADEYALADEARYLSVIELESKTLARGAASEFLAEADELESSAKANVAMLNDREDAMAMRCARMLKDIDAASANRAVQANVAGAENLESKLGALAGRVRSEEAAASHLKALNVRALDAKSTN